MPYSWWEVSALGIAVWLIYMLDHLKDANKLITPLAERRKFHARHFRSLRAITLLVALFGLVVCWFLDEEILVVGSLVAAISAFYLFVSKRIDWFKEFWIAISYALGVLLVPTIRTGLSTEILIALIALTILALVNLMIFSWFEREIDEKEGFRSFANVFSEQMVKVTIWLSFAVLAIVIAFGWYFEISLYVNLYFTFLGLVFLIIWRTPWFQEEERYRWVGDAVFMLPIVFFLLP